MRAKIVADKNTGYEKKSLSREAQREKEIEKERMSMTEKSGYNIKCVRKRMRKVYMEGEWIELKRNGGCVSLKTREIIRERVNVREWELRSECERKRMRESELEKKRIRESMCERESKRKRWHREN